MTDVTNKQCPRCGNPFSCCQGDISKCGCSTVTLNADALSYLRSTYNDCLCNTCLKDIMTEYEHSDGKN